MAMETALELPEPSTLVGMTSLATERVFWHLHLLHVQPLPTYGSEQSDSTTLVPVDTK